MKYKAWVPYLLLAALTLAAFWKGFLNDFTNWDDPAYITENRLIRGLSWERVAAAFSGFYLQNYNPLHLLSYMVDYSLWGLRPEGFFLFNLLLHLASGVLIWRIFSALSGAGTGAALASVVFLVHPTRCESVVWLSERKDVLSGFFALASLWLYLGWARQEPEAGKPSRSRYAASVALFLLALLSKSQVVTLPLASFALALYLRRNPRRAALDQLPFLALSAVFSVVALSAHAPESGEVLDYQPVGILSALRPLAALPQYLVHLLLPFGLSPYYGAGATGSGAMALPLGVLAGGAILGAAAWGMARSASRERVFLAGAAWFAALLLPVSGVVTNQVLVADRYLYLPAAGLAWIAGDCLSRALPQYARHALLAAAAGLMAWATSGYGEVWRGAESLWLRVLSSQPDCALAQANLGTYRLVQGRIDEARRLFEEDLERKPYFMESFFGLAEISRKEGRLEEAIATFDRITALRPNSLKAAIRFAVFLSENGRDREALDHLRRRETRPSFVLHQVLFKIQYRLGCLREARRHAALAVELNPFHEEGWYHLGLAEERLGNVSGAAAAYDMAIAREASFQAAYLARATLAFNARRPREALNTLDRAPKREAPWWNLRAISLSSLSEHRQALEAAREAARLEPQNANYAANLARIAWRAGERAEAEKALREAVSRDPKLEETLDPDIKRLLGG